MSFLLADCKELDFGELLAVNGGCAGGGVCSGGYGGGGGNQQPQPKPTAPKNPGSPQYPGGVNNTPSGSGDCSGTINTGVGTSTSGDCSGRPRIPQTPYDNDEGEKKPEDDYGEQKKYDVTEESGNDSVTKIKKAIDDFGDDSAGKGEKKNAYKVGEFQCDDYVEKMLTDAGYDPKDYYVDDPSGKTVNTHISELKAAGADKYSTDASSLTDGVYVVFMQDEDGSSGSHAALLVVDTEGSSYMYDNSSHNFPGRDDAGNIIRDENGKIASFEGGIEKTGWNNSTPKNICDQYPDYEKFYFQKIK